MKKMIFVEGLYVEEDRGIRGGRKE